VYVDAIMLLFMAIFSALGACQLAGRCQ